MQLEEVPKQTEGGKKTYLVLPGGTGFRFRIWTPFSHLVLRQPVATVFPKPKVAWDSGNLPKLGLLLLRCCHLTLVTQLHLGPLCATLASYFCASIKRYV